MQATANVRNIVSTLYEIVTYLSHFWGGVLWVAFSFASPHISGLSVPVPKYFCLVFFIEVELSGVIFMETTCLVIKFFIFFLGIIFIFLLLRYFFSVHILIVIYWYLHLSVWLFIYIIHLLYKMILSSADNWHLTWTNLLGFPIDKWMWRKRNNGFKIYRRFVLFS